MKPRKNPDRDRDLILRTEVEIVDSDPLVLFVPNIKRVFDFKFLLASFTVSKSISIANSLATWFSAYKRPTAVGRYQIFKQYMLALPSLTEQEYGIRKRDRILRDKAFGVAVHAWLSQREKFYGNNLTTFAEIANSLKRCLDHMVQCGLAVKVLPYQLKRNYHHTKKRRLSLVEQEAKGAPFNMLDDVADVLKKHDSTISDEELHGFLRTFANQGNDKETSPEQLLDLMYRRTTELLRYIRELAEGKLLHWIQVYEDGQKLLATADENVVAQFIKASDAPIAGRAHYWATLFPKDNDQMSLTNFLKIIQVVYGGVFPGENGFVTRSLYQKLLRRLGGRSYLNAMLSAHPDAVASAALLYMVDTGANVTTALALDPDFESKSEYENHVKIDSVKGKAQNTQIVNNLPIVDAGHSLSTVQALRMIKRMSSNLRSRNAAFANHLFIFQFYTTPSIANTEFLYNRLNYFQRDDDENDIGKLTPSGIRISYLLHKTIQKDGDTFPAMVLADHVEGTGVTERYTVKWPVRIIYVNSIRKFSSLLENQLIFGLDDAKKKFGASAASKLMDGSERTGVGLSCKLKAEGDAVADENGCPGVGNCPSCDHKFFHVSDENMHDIVVANKWFHENKERLEATATAKWINFYIPIFAFTEVALEKISRSRHAKKLEKVRLSTGESSYSALEFLG